MNKRQIKKRSKIQWERLNFVSLYYTRYHLAAEVRSADPRRSGHLPARPQPDHRDLRCGILVGRRNGKTQLLKNIVKMCIQKQHRPFKDFKKWVLKQQKLNPPKTERRSSGLKERG